MAVPVCTEVLLLLLNSLAELSLCCCFAFLFYPPKWQLDCGIQTCQQPAGKATGPALPAQ